MMVAFRIFLVGLALCAVSACNLLSHSEPAAPRPTGLRWRLSGKIDIEAIEEIVCEAAEGTVHRLWEPLAAKQRPPNAYAGKFSQPYCIAAGFVLGNAGLDAFTEERVADPRLRALAAKVRYQIDPDNPYPNEYTGHVRVKLKNGAPGFTLEDLQAFLADKIGKHEMPAALEIREALPRTSVGKLSKIELREDERRKAENATL